MLDLGGGSFQITFSPQDEVGQWAPNGVSTSVSSSHKGQIRLTLTTDLRAVLGQAKWILFTTMNVFGCRKPSRCRLLITSDPWGCSITHTQSTHTGTHTLLFWLPLFLSCHLSCDLRAATWVWDWCRLDSPSWEVSMLRHVRTHARTLRRLPSAARGFVFTSAFCCLCANSRWQHWAGQSLPCSRVLRQLGIRWCCLHS